MQLELGTAIDRYVVESLVGLGGVASVYRVRHNGLGTVHALKVVHLPSPAITERLLREGRVQGRLRHPNVVSVTDLVTVRGAPGLVMELVPGPSLDRFLQQVELDLDEADAIARGILAGVAAAHRVGLVHRDLKPGNVLIDVADGQVVPKIVDFGLAKVLEADSPSPIETRAGASLGTPAYMAPEQIVDASSVDERADVFALGAILYELVTGERAFQGESVEEVYALIAAGEHAPIPDTLPARMQRAIEGALQIDPEDRTATVAELLSRWTDRTPPPLPAWSADTLRIARTPAASLEPSGSGASSSTFAGENSYQTTQETWTGDGVVLGTTVPEVSSKAPRRTERRAGLWLGLLLGSVVVALAASWILVPGVDPVLDVDHVPVITQDVAQQRQFEQAWEAWLAGDFVETDRRLRPIREAAPEAPLPPLLASGALMFLGDVPEGLDALTEARTAAANHPDAPGAELVEVYRRMQIRGGASVGPELDAYLEAHPTDFLARVLAAQYCSTTSEVATCERYHEALLRHDDRQVVAHAARVRSWLDLGELDRARAAAADGLAIDPAEPDLLLLKGSTWLAEGEVDKARHAFEEALAADPRRRDPKIGMAQAALMADDGTWDRATAELLAPTVPPADRVGVHTEAYETLFGLGRVGEALEHLERARAIEAQEGTPLGELTVLSRMAPVFKARHDLEGLADLVEQQLRLVATNPEIPNPVRNRYAYYSPWVEGLRAAKAGDTAGVEKAIARIQASEHPQPSVVENLARELAVLREDADAIAQTGSFFWTDCDRYGVLGEAYRRVGASERAAEAWRKVLDSPCRMHRPERRNRVGALVGLAELAQADGADFERLLTEAEALWPSPDPDLPLTLRLRALRGPVQEAP